MKFNKNSLGKTLTGSAVPILFIIISAVAIPLSKYSGSFMVGEIITRLSRNSFLVLALLLPVMAGMGINFGIVLGAMAGQLGLIFITDWGVKGAPGLLLAMAIGTPIVILLGYFCGAVLNRAKGREMITSMMLGFFILGIYQAFTLYLCGLIIPIRNPKLLLSRGYGIRNAINLDVIYGFDNLVFIKKGNIMIPIGTCLFHLMFIVMPMAGKNLTNQAMIGEYLRMFVSYGIVTLALVLHSWKRQKDKEMDRAYLRQEFNKAKGTLFAFGNNLLKT